MPTALKKTISAEHWEQKLAAVKVSKEDMNRLVMNFLVTEVGGLFVLLPLTGWFSNSSQCRL